jgi:F-type H+-transporting ATPase subunit c
MADIETTKMAAYIAAGVCMGLGAIGPALGQGFIGGKACESISKRPENYNLIMRALFLSLVLVETCAIYVFLVALILLFLKS